jgi:hypothetical protein
MPRRFAPVDYSALNSRQKENYNFQKISAALADYGYATLRLSDDWNGADFIAQHINGTILSVQLKSRLGFYKRYIGKGLYIAFPFENEWYLYDHDELLNIILKSTSIGSTESWVKRGRYSFPRIPKQLHRFLEPYKVPGSQIVAVQM